MNPQMTTTKNVCVIGAGPSGLVAARELRKEGHKVVVMEQKHEVGGQWLYDPNVEGEDPLGRATKFLRVHSSMYESLRLTSPREVMGFTDFPFRAIKGRDMRRFPSHRELLLYLKDFCDHFGLRGLIRFNTRVEYAGFVEDSGDPRGLRWVVKSRDVADDVVVEEVFDAVVVASGHYSYPKLPTIEGMDSWKRRQLHSHIYRTPESFHDEVVVVVGNSMSGHDISMEVAGVAKDVYLSVKSLDDIFEGLSKVIAKLHNLHLRPQVVRVEEEGRVVFVDGSSVIADTIIYCTGYSYTFPFLDTKGIVTVDDNRVGPLYEHTFPPSLAPSLSFIGIPRKIIAFPFFESQAKWIAEVLSGKKKLPTPKEMLDYIDQFYQARQAAGIPKRYTHEIAEFEYCDKLSDMVGFPRLEEWRKELCLSAILNSLVNLDTYRDVYDHDFQLLQVAFQSPHFTQFPSQHVQHN